MTFEPDLALNIARGDENYLSLLNAADAYVARNGLDLPEEPQARDIPSDPECVTHPILDLDLAKAGVTSIIWATGYAVDFSWLDVDAFDEKGKPKHQRGVSKEPGIYFLGLPWLSRRGSAFIWGVCTMPGTSLTISSRSENISLTAMPRNVMRVTIVTARIPICACTKSARWA